MNFFLVLFVFILFTYISAGEEISKEKGALYTTNRFNDIFPQWQGVPEEELTEKLLGFVESIKDKKNSAIRIEVPHDRSSIFSALIKANFIFHYADQCHSEWIIKNGSSIPPPFTAISGAHILVIYDGNILMIEERTRQGILGFPGGGTDSGEFVRETACRELLEETGLIVQPDDLKLVALINRIKFNKEEASLFGHGFVAEIVNGSLDLDPVEIMGAFWVPIVELVQASEVNHLKVSPYINVLSKHIINGCASSYSLKLPDSSPTNPSRTMNVEFIQQNLNIRSSIKLMGEEGESSRD